MSPERTNRQSGSGDQTRSGDQSGSGNRPGSRDGSSANVNRVNDFGTWIPPERQANEAERPENRYADPLRQQRRRQEVNEDSGDEAEHALIAERRAQMPGGRPENRYADTLRAQRRRQEVNEDSGDEAEHALIAEGQPPTGDNNQHTLDSGTTLVNTSEYTSIIDA